MSLLATRAAYNVMKMSGHALRTMTAGELNELVAGYPPPAEAVKMMGIPIGDCPILFEETDPLQLGSMLGENLWSDGAPWPVFYMPMSVMEVWDKHPHSVQLLSWFREKGLDIQLTLGGNATWLRGHWVMLCDIRLRFLTNEHQEALEGMAMVAIEGPKAG